MLPTFTRCICSASRPTSSFSALHRAGPASSGLLPRHQSTSARVQGHPHLYLHPTATKDRYTVSYLSSPPFSEDSPTVLGTCQGKSVTPTTFEENPQWRTMMHEILSSAVWSDDTLQTQAVNRIEGYLHIIDERNPPALNRAGEPEDIVGSVLCNEGELVEGQYEPGDAYRIVTINGPMQLSAGLTKSLIRSLEVARSVEQQMYSEENANS